MEETIVISLGGSLIVPEEIDIEFLKSFKSLILAQVEKGKKFLIITGGGKINRKYNEAAKMLSNPSTEDLDWIGLTICNVNAQLVRVIFRESTCKKVFYDVREEELKDSILKYPIVIGGTLEPGHSSDFDAVLAAKNVGAKKVINLSNTDYAYDKDPKKYPDAKKLESVSWAEYRALIPKEWTAKLDSPFDPIASQIAEEAGMTVMTMNGRDIENLVKCLNGEKFIGTVIS